MEDKLVINELLLEITRNCTLECEHCLKGDCQKFNIDDNTLNNVFKDIKSIKTLVLTGGEPLLAPNAIIRIAELIKKYNINVGTVLIVTNGTVMSEKTLNALEIIRDAAPLKLSISYDIFHSLCLDKKGLKEIRNKNAKIFEERFNATHYDQDTPYDLINGHRQRIYIFPRGRAETLSSDRLSEIGDLVNVDYTRDSKENYDNDCFFKPEGSNILRGSVTIDVFGNVVKNNVPYVEEDIYSKDSNLNVNSIGLYDAICNHIHRRNLGNCFYYK